MKVCVVGLGYIGLPTAAVLARTGVEVVGVDCNPDIVRSIGEGKTKNQESGLAELIADVVQKGRLRTAEEPETADAFIITVPTPLTEDKQADLAYVEQASRSIVSVLGPGNIVVLESTSPVGTVDERMRPILEQGGLVAGRDFYLGYSPERVIPGNILEELVTNDRIAGGIDAASAGKIADLYRLFVQGTVYETDARTAELCKLAENTYRDINIAFANELALISEKQHIDVWELIPLCNRHPRVNIHRPGPGVGGHCIAVDPWFIAENNPGEARLIRQAREINDHMPGHVAHTILELLEVLGQKKEAGRASGQRDTAKDTEPTVAVLGITYKPNVNDTRESPLLSIMDILKRQGVRVRWHDPHVQSDPDNAPSASEAARGADILLLGVDHTAFRALDYAALARAMRHRILLDTRNFVDREAARRAGFIVRTLGRRPDESPRL